MDCYRRGMWIFIVGFSRTAGQGRPAQWHGHLCRPTERPYSILTGGTVEAILVKEGDHVKAGQPLVRFNAVQVTASAEMARVKYFTARAAEARLIAERDGADEIVFPPDLSHEKDDPRVASNMRMQEQLLSSRLMAIESELAAIDENIAGLKLQSTGLEESRDNKKAQMKFLKEQLDGMRELAKEGYVARNRLLDLERTYSQLSGAISGGY